MHIYVYAITISEKDLMNLKESREGCIGKNRCMKERDEFCNFKIKNGNQKCSAQTLCQISVKVLLSLGIK